MIERMRRMGLRAALTVLVLGSGLARSSSAQEADASSEFTVAWDSVAVRVIDGVETFFMLNARFNQGETFLISDRARDEGPDGYLFEGNVRIVERGDTIYADVVRYNKETKIGRATGNVRLTDGLVHLRSSTAIYDTDRKMTTFDAGVTLVDSLTVLESRGGRYWSDESRAEFVGAVRLVQDDLRLEADSVTYLRETEETWAASRVYVERSDWPAPDSTGIAPVESVLEDTAAAQAGEGDRTILFADRVYHDGRTDSSAISGHVFLLQIRSDSSTQDSLMVTSSEMILTRSAERERVIAMDSVTVWEGSFSVRGDSLVYDRVGSGDSERVESRVFGHPVAWLDKSQITSDSLRTVGTGGSLDTLFATGDVFVAELDSLEDRFQQIRGRQLVGQFDADSLRVMTVRQNAEALYFMTNDVEEPAGAIRASADRIVFYFSGGEVSDIGVYEGVEGTYYPENLVEQADNLSGFVWMPDRKPDRVVMRELFHSLSATRIGNRTDPENF